MPVVMEKMSLNTDVSKRTAPLDGSDNQSSNPMSEINTIKFQQYNKTTIFQLKTLKREIKSMVIENCQLEFRKMSRLIANLWHTRATKTIGRITKINEFYTEIFLQQKECQLITS